MRGVGMSSGKLVGGAAAAVGAEEEYGEEVPFFF